MCGIFGCFGLVDKNLLKKAVKSMTHRGPDSKGYFTDDKVMLGVRRLKIIDLEKGDQPIFNEDKSVVVVYNGEIYNYKELKKHLEAKGHKFYTNSDTEVIVHSYEEYGEKCVTYFNGMFAIALWDSNKKKLFVFRDRYGIKPLYYYKSKDIFLFSSEIKALLNYEELPRNLNTKVLPFYLKYRYIKSPDIFIKDIKKLHPGHFCEVDIKQVKVKKYYSLKLSQDKENPNKITSDLSDLLEGSVKKRVISDVPLGLFLSGGIDSTTLLHYMKKFKTDKIKTFTIGFENDNNTNEFHSARQVSEFYQTEHHEISVDADTFIRHIPKVLYNLEEPIADATAVSTYLLSNFASKKVKTILSGEGADELFGGYVYYSNMKYFEKFQKLPYFLQKTGRYSVKFLPEKMLSHFFKYPERIGLEGKQRLLNLLSNNKSEVDAYDHFISLYGNYDLDKVLLTSATKTNIKIGYKNMPIHKRMFYDSMTSWLPDYILTRIDKMSMANSLECRVPFLDHRLVDYISKIDYKNKTEKFLLRKMVRNKIPSFIVKKPKFPFYSPLIDWFNFGLKEYYEEVFSESQLIKKKVIEAKHIVSLFRNYEKSELINSRKLWSLMTLELSYRNFIENY